MIKLEDLSEVPEDKDIPWLDRKHPFAEYKPEENSDLHSYIKEWRETGVVHLNKFLPDELIEEYCELRKQHRAANGWVCITPYMYFKELRDICLYPPLMRIMRSLIGHPMGLHLNLTGWVTTTRAWHMDDYLNPPHVNSHYTAVWMALDDIHPDSGPFQYVPGSHSWPLLRREKIWAHMTPEEKSTDAWPAKSERVCIPAFEEYIQRTGSEVVTYLPKKGDVLIWHGRLCHQGSLANVPGMRRKALIAHYSSINHRSDMPKATTWRTDDQHYFPITAIALDADGPRANV